MTSTQAQAQLNADLLAALARANTAPSTYVVGAYYYPGWMAGDPFNAPHQPDPWSSINGYPEREPVMGRWDDSLASCARRHVTDAQVLAGIDYFSVVSFYQGTPGADTVTMPAKPAAALFALLIAAGGTGFRISVTLDFNASRPIDMDGAARAAPARFLARFDSMCAQLALVIQAFNDRWLMRDSKYVITVRGEYWSSNFVPASGLTSAQLLSRMRTTMAAASPAINAVGMHVTFWGTYSGFWLRGVAQASGFDSFSTYGILAPNLNKDGPAATAPAPTPTSYAALAAAQMGESDWLLNGPQNASNTIGYTLPICGGWDARPWNGPTIGRPTPAEFEAHARAALVMVNADMASYNRTRGHVIVGSWNEMGEGSYIVPTAGDGGALCAVIRNAFKP